MSADRMRRVDEAMREVLSDAITSGLKDPRVGFVTVTAVQTSPDLRHARVFVSVLGAASVRRLTMDGLRSAHGYLQKRVAAELRLKQTPTRRPRSVGQRGRADRGRRRGRRSPLSPSAARSRTTRVPRAMTSVAIGSMRPNLVSGSCRVYDEVSTARRGRTTSQTCESRCDE